MDDAFLFCFQVSASKFDTCLGWLVVKVEKEGIFFFTKVSIEADFRFCACMISQEADVSLWDV